MEAVEFMIRHKPCGRWGMNSLYSGKHWAKRDKEAAEMHLIVRAALSECRIPRRLFTAPVAVHIRYNSRMDIDNHGYLSKLIIDGLKGWLIEDDSRKYVKALYQEFHSMDAGLIFVRIEEWREHE
ncbi:MAG: hypothetical protein IJN11_10375 [Oscillospiraceae bacterium]|nr:hypothetical protein [Oscillospiraceae bacterium]